MEYKNTKLIVFLNAFSKDEITDFEKFLTSPFFKTNRDLLPFFNELKRFYPDYSSEKFNEENVFSVLYPDFYYSDKKSKDIMRTLSSSLLKAAEEFLYISDIRNNKVLKNRTILKILLHKNLTKFYDQYKQSAINELESDKTEFEEDFLESFYLERLNTRYYSLKLDFKNLFVHTNKSVELISTYFWLDLIRTAKTNLLGGLSRNFKPENNPVEKILEVINMEDVLKIYANTPQYVQLCFNYYTYKCLKDKNETELYEKAKKIFFENITAISRYEKNFYYADLLNIVLIRNVSDNTKMRKEAFHLLKSCLKDKAYKISDADYMQPDFYRNVVLNSIYFKEYEWLDSFIIDYTDELKPEYRENMKYYSTSLMYYGKGEFEMSLEAVSKVKYELELFKLDVKILMLKIFYELNLFEQAYSLTDTFKHYIKKSERMRPEIKESYNNYVKYFLKIIKMKEFQKFSESGIIKTQLNNEKLVFQKTWLTEKLNMIEAV